MHATFSGQSLSDIIVPEPQEQLERMIIIFSKLISLFERAFLLLYGDRHVGKTAMTKAFMGRLYGRMV